MGKKVSLKDIANKVGVSIATVSYVLSKGEKSGITKEVSELVKKAANELNYQPNQIAKSLKTGKTFTIGLIVADISNPFFAEIARKIEDEAKKYSYTVIFGSSDEQANKSWDLIQFLANRQVDGFIIAPCADSEEHIKYLKKQNIPYVLFDRYFPEIPSNYVVSNNYQAAYDATSRLIKTGNKKVGMMVYSTPLIHMQERIRGYQTALKDHHIKDDFVYKVAYNNLEGGVVKGIDTMLETYQLDSLFFATNTLTIYGLKHLDKLGLKVPTDISVISFDQSIAFDFYYCPLTHIKQPLYDIGKETVKLLIEEINQNKFIDKQVCLETELIIRDSCVNLK